jgi:nucleobase:cation symporter-1, NCS1 family
MTAEKGSLQAQADQETLYGTIPLLKKERMYGFWDLLWVSGSFAIASWCYVQGANIALMVNFWQAVASTLGPIMAFGVIVTLVGTMSTRYGIDHWVYQRAVFGYVGVLFVCFVAIASTWGWYAINAQLFGHAVTKVFNSFGAGIGDGWFKPLAMVCVVVGWALAMMGPGGVKWSTRIMAPCMLVAGTIIFILVIVKGHSVIFSSGPIGSKPHTKGSLESYSLVVEWNLAFVLSWYPIIGAITRLVRRERQAHWALWLGYAACMVIFVLIATATALIMAPQLKGGLSTDPTDYLLQIGGKGLGTLSLILIAMANITTMTVGVYGLTVGSKLLRPNMNYYVVGTGWAIWCGALTAWGGIWTYYPKFLAVIGIVAGPALALIITDYWVVRRQKISVRSMYDTRDGAYKYTYGFNIPGFIAFFVGFAAYLLVYDPINYVVRSSIFHYLTATGLASICAACFYALESLIPAVKRYLTRDVNEAASTRAEVEAALGGLEAEAPGAVPGLQE